MAKIVKSPRHRGPSRRPEVGAEIERLCRIVAESWENRLLARGPVSPDDGLLDVCAESLYLLTHAERAFEEGHASLQRDVAESRRTGNWSRPPPPEIDKAFEESENGRQKAKPLLDCIRKLRAKTAAGIYAKALVVRCSTTGASRLAMSLAEDLIACPELRATLWPAKAEECAGACDRSAASGPSAFDGCGFDNRLIGALIRHGYTRREQLLPLTDRQLSRIFSVGPKGRAKIKAWQEGVHATGGGGPAEAR